MAVIHRNSQSPVDGGILRAGGECYLPENLLEPRNGLQPPKHSKRGADAGRGIAQFDELGVFQNGQVDSKPNGQRQLKRGGRVSDIFLNMRRNDRGDVMKQPSSPGWESGLPVSFGPARHNQKGGRHPTFDTSQAMQDRPECKKGLKKIDNVS